MNRSLIDLFWKILCITIIVGLVICCVAYLFDKNSVNVGFVKDVYSGLVTVIAPLIAIYLFTDWKEQHNKKIISDEAKKLLVSVEEDNLNFTGLIAALKSVDTTQPVQQIYNDLISEYVSKFNKNSEYNHNLSYLVHELNESDKFKKSMDNYNNVTLSIIKDLQKRLKENQKTEDILKKLESIRRNYLLLNKLYKEEIKKHILAK